MNTKTETKTIVVFGRYRYYTADDLLEIIETALKEKDYGFSERFYLHSTMDPYDDCEGDAELIVEYERELTPYERKEEKRQKKIAAYAKEKGVTFYEATTLLRLKDKGVEL